MAINGLMTRRSFIVTEAPEPLVDDLTAIDRSLDYLALPMTLAPSCRVSVTDAYSEMLRLIRGVLRDATEPMSSRENRSRRC